MRFKKIFIISLLSGLLFVSGVTSAFAAFGDSFISRQLAPNPSSGNCLSTDGIFNLWSTCTSGGGGGAGTFSTTSTAGKIVQYPYTSLITSLDTSATTSSKWFFDPNTAIQYIKGKLGIGTTTPYAPLSVVGQGGVVAENFNATSTTATSTFAGDVKGRKLLDTTDVAYWGAKGDGVTDDTAAFQAAIAASKVVRISQPGTYILNSTLYLSSNQTLEGLASTTIKKGSNYGHFIANVGSNTDGAYPVYDTDITVRNIKFIDDYTGTLTGAASFTANGLIQFKYATKVTLENISLYAPNNVIMYGIHFQSVTYSTIRNYTDVNRKDGFHFNGGTHDIVVDGFDINSYDDTSALACDDYPRVEHDPQDIYNITYNNGVSHSDRGSLGHLVWIVTGSWTDWTSGNTYEVGNTVRNAGNLYKMVTTTTKTGTVAPTHTSGDVTGADGIQWRYVGTHTNTTCNVYNVSLNNIYMMDGRPVFRTVDNDTNNNSEYPGTENTSYLDQLSMSNMMASTTSGQAYSSYFVNWAGKTLQTGNFFIKNVGIGTTYPYAQLSVKGTGTGSNRLVEFVDSASTTAFTVLENGNTGVGMTPTFKLDVAGPIRISGNVGTVQPALSRNSSGGLTASSTGPLAQTGNIFDVRQSSGTVNFNVLQNGNVGLSTTSPFARLSVHGDGYFAGYAKASNFVATSSIASVFPYATTTALSAGTLCLTGDSCITSWPVGGGGGSGTDVNWTNFNNSGIYVSTTTNQVLIGSTSTSSLATLELKKTAPFIQLIDSSVGDSSQINFEAQNVGIGRNSNNLYLGNGANGDIVVTGNSSSNDFKSLTEIARFKTSNGYVGIGTSTPTATLDVYGVGRFVGATSNGFSIGSDTNYRRIDTAGTAPQHFRFLDSDNTYDGARMEALSIGGTYANTTAPSNGLLVQGNVGIGTTSPSTTLSVNGEGYFVGNIRGTNITATGTLAVSGTGTSTFANGIALSGGCLSINGSCLTGGAGGGSGTVNSGTTGQLAFYGSDGTAVSGTSTLYLATSGNVGIGTVSPAVILDIRQSTANKGITVRPADGGSETFDLYVTNSGTATFNSNDSMMFSSTLDSFFRAGSNRSINIADTTNATVSLVMGGGNVGIGTSSPYAKLSISGNGVFDGNLRATNLTATGTVTTNALTISSITGSTQCLQVNTSGVVSGTGSACGAGGGGSSTVGGFTTLATSTSMSIDICSSSYATSTTLSMGIGSANIAVTMSGSACLGKWVYLDDYTPSSGLIGSTTFSGVNWNGQLFPGTSSVNGLMDRFKFTVTATSTAFITGDYVGSY